MIMLFGGCLNGCVYRGGGYLLADALLIGTAAAILGAGVIVEPPAYAYRHYYNPDVYAPPVYPGYPINYWYTHPAYPGYIFFAGRDGRHYRYRYSPRHY